jgi:gamma-carbonic anhydrase
MIRPFLGVEPRLEGDNYVAPSAEVIGDVVLGRETSVWFNATIRGDVNWIRIGAHSNVQDNAVIHVTRATGPTLVGDSVTIGHGAVIHGCTLCDRVLVGIGAIVLDGATIESDCIVGAGAVVTPGTRIPSGSLVLGTPARVIRPLSDEDVATILRHAENYRRYGAVYSGRENPPVNPFYRV